jgi:hypothetical protein
VRDVLQNHHPRIRVHAEQLGNDDRPHRRRHRQRGDLPAKARARIGAADDVLHDGRLVTELHQPHARPLAAGDLPDHGRHAQPIPQVIPQGKQAIPQGKQAIPHRKHAIPQGKIAGAMHTPIQPGRRHRAPAGDETACDTGAVHTPNSTDPPPLAPGGRRNGVGD